MRTRGIALGGSLVLSLALGGCGRWGFDEGVAGPDAACALTVSPNPGRVNLNSGLTFVAEGGVPGYTFAFDGDPGGATIEPTTGRVRAGPEPGTAIVQVTDAVGCRATADLTIGGATLWYAGGSTMAVPSREVWRTNDGLAWSLAGTLPARRTNGALVAFRNQLIFIAGSDGAQVMTVFASADGATWSTIGALPMPASNFGFAVHGDRLIVVGGNGNGDNVYASDDGVTWSMVGRLPDPNHGGILLSRGDRLWYVGGHDGSLYDWVLSSVDGAVWTMEGTIPLAREYHSGLVVEGTIWVVGGQDTTPTRLADVSVSGDGTNWSSIAPLPAARAFSPLVKFLDRIWSLGGSDMGGVFSTDRTTWTQHTTNFPVPRQGGAAAVFTPP